MHFLYINHIPHYFVFARKPLEFEYVSEIWEKCIRFVPDPTPDEDGAIKALARHMPWTLVPDQTKKDFEAMWAILCVSFSKTEPEVESVCAPVTHKQKDAALSRRPALVSSVDIHHTQRDFPVLLRHRNEDGDFVYYTDCDGNDALFVLTYKGKN